MSIQEKKLLQVGRKKIILKPLNFLYVLWQMITRLSCNNSLKVFYPYKYILYTHPFFFRHYENPPVSYSNFFNAKLFHCINSLPAFTLQRPYVIESNDHPLAVTKKSEPKEVLSRIDEASNIYMNNNCKKILVEGEGQLLLFRKYLSEDILRKTEIVRIGASPKNVDFCQKFKNVENPIFICLASDYKKKAVDLLIKAWLNFSQKQKCQLILACPNVPIEVQKLFKKNQILLINKAPLTEVEKTILLNQAHIMIAPLHVDGGANIIEAFEHGLPVITMRSQRSFIRNGNGWEVNVPFYFYDDGYGKDWPTWIDFWNLVESAKKNHDFDETVNSLVNIFEQIACDPHKLKEMGKQSLELAKGIFSLNERNKKLRKIYYSALH